MASKTIDQLTELTSLESNDLLIAYDISELGDEKIRKITKTNAFAGIDVGDVTTAQLTATSGVLQTNIDGKAATSHDHDGRYYTETELTNGQLDTRYYTESEINTISGALNTKITDKDNVKLTSTPATDNSASGFTATMQVDTNTVGIGAALFMAADGNFDEADADAAATMPCSALALETSTGSKIVLLQGFIRHDAWNWTPGGVVYVSQTQGTLTQTAPSAANSCIQPVGIATHADRILFNPTYGYVVHA
jgi:hypothetical protein